MPKAHQRYANTTPHTLRREAAKVGTNTAIFIERLLCDRPHPEQGSDLPKAFFPWRVVTNPIGWNWLASERWSSTH